MSNHVLFTESSPNVGGQTLLQRHPLPLLDGGVLLSVRFCSSVHLPMRCRQVPTYRPWLAICHDVYDCNKLTMVDSALLSPSYVPLGMSLIEALDFVSSRTDSASQTIIDTQSGSLLPSGNVQNWDGFIAEALQMFDKIRSRARTGHQDRRPRFLPHTNTTRLLALAGLAATAAKEP